MEPPASPASDHAANNLAAADKNGWAFSTLSAYWTRSVVVD
jgi:hypothetical protein